MVCPRCASNQSEDIKFCTFCGANLQAVREVIDAPEVPKKFEWGDTWVAEMFRSGEAAERAKLEMARRLGITPEVKRYNEIQAGVILCSVGVGLSIFLFVFMQGIAGKVEPDAAEIILRIWVAGIIPFMIGLAFILNGMVVSRRIVEAMEREQNRTRELEDAATAARGLRAADTSEFIPTNMSVTDQTTRHLQESKRKVT